MDVDLVMQVEMEKDGQMDGLIHQKTLEIHGMKIDNQGRTGAMAPRGRQGPHGKAWEVWEVLRATRGRHSLKHGYSRRGDQPTTSETGPHESEQTGLRCIMVFI